MPQVRIERFTTEDVQPAEGHHRTPRLAKDLLEDLGALWIPKEEQRKAVANWLVGNEADLVLMSDLEDEDLLGAEPTVSPSTVRGDRFIGTAGTDGVSIRSV